MGIFDRLRSAFGREPVVAEERAAPIYAPEMGSVLPQLPLALQLQRIGGGLTPMQVSEIIRQADVGYMYRLVDLANEARQKDCHLQAILGTRETALKGLRWQIDAGEDKGTRRKDRKAAEWCEEALKASANFPDLVAHMAGGNYYGYAVSETLYALDAGKIVPAKFLPVSARRFIFELTAGELRQWDPYGGSLKPYPGINLQQDFPGKFLVFQPRVNGDVPCREGLARVLMWAALYRNWDLRDWITLGELAWKPWRVGTYTKGADQKDIDSLGLILQAMSASGTAKIPDSVKLDVQWPKGVSEGGTHAALFAVLGAEMSKAVLGQTLTTEQGSKGSQSLGNVHDKVRRDILESDAVAAAACIRRDIVAPLIRMNFGDGVAIPEFRFLTEDGIDLASYSKAIATLKGAGLKIKASDVRDATGLGTPDEDDEILGAGEAPGDSEPDPKDPGEANEPAEEESPGDESADAEDAAAAA
jgi:phage gp29-like protein